MVHNAPFLDGLNPTQPRHKDITEPPPIRGTVFVETATTQAALPYRNHSSSTASTSSSSSRPSITSLTSNTSYTSNGSSVQNQPAGAPSDVAGVLRRNQACLACRRRKLKCDAVRPHCSTCVRSYRHLLRTAPGTNPVLSCEYDDSTDKDHASGGTGSEGAGTQDERTSPPGDDDDGKKKKRKASGGRKRREEGLDEERDRLAKRVAELEQMLARKSLKDTTATAPAIAPQPQLAPAPSGEQPVHRSADTSNPNASPWTGFTAPPMQSPSTILNNFISGSSSNSTMFTTAVPVAPSAASVAPVPQPVGLTPLWTSDDRTELYGMPQYPYLDTDVPMLPLPNPPPDGSGPLMLSPEGIFNFSPAPTGPTVDMATSTAGVWLGEAPSTPYGSKPGSSSAKATEETSRRQSESARSEQADIDIDSFNINAANSNMLDSQILVDLFWPGWPVNLPDPPVVTSLVDAFFDYVPNMPRLLHRQRFLTRMALPPTHSDFPHPSLIHAICAITATWCPPSLYEGTGTKGRRGAPQPSPTMPFTLWQAALAKDAVQDGLNTGSRLLDVVRAMILLCRVFSDDTRMLECWTYCGLVSRMVLPLGLNVRSAEISLKSVMLPPPVDAVEREERRAVLWMAMYNDTIASAASGWGTTMSLDELTVPLPVSKHAFDAADKYLPPNPQDLESLDLYIKHPDPDSFVMMLKGAVLLNRVNRFARKWKNRRLRDNDDLDGMQRPEFRELANAIACMRMSFPPSLKDPTALDEKNRFDPDLVSAHVLPHAATICLYEPFADITNPDDQAARRIRNAAQAVLSVVHTINKVDAGDNVGVIMYSSSAVALVTAARTLLLFYRHALNMNDHAQAKQLRDDIEMARSALGQLGVRFKIGYHHAQLLEYFLDRATHPTYQKLAAHYPEHPREGAIELTPDAHLGMCILNALNIKRGYWRITPGMKQAHASRQARTQTNSMSPTDSPESSAASHRNSTTDSPSTNPPPLSTASGSGSVSGSASAPVSAPSSEANVTQEQDFDDSMRALPTWHFSRATTFANKLGSVEGLAGAGRGAVDVHEGEAGDRISRSEADAGQRQQPTNGTRQGSEVEPPSRGRIYSLDDADGRSMQVDQDTSITEDDSLGMPRLSATLESSVNGGVTGMVWKQLYGLGGPCPTGSMERPDKGRHPDMVKAVPPAPTFTFKDDSSNDTNLPGEQTLHADSVGQFRDGMTRPPTLPPFYANSMGIPTGVVDLG